MSLLDQQRDDEHRIKELMQMTDDLENSSDFVNFKDCRPGSSTMSAISKSQSGVKGKSIQKSGKGETLAIQKSTKHQQSTKRAQADQHAKHAS